MHTPSIMIVAGDHSGDLHAAPVIRQLALQCPGVATWGIGGSAMQHEGFEALMPFEPFNKMGIVEVATHIQFFLNAKHFLVEQMRCRRPDLLLCVDYPGMNMLLMKAARELGIPVVWYIAPMVWAWKKKRAITLGNNTDHIAVIFPFEVKHFSGYKAPVTFVGNPLIESMEKENRFRDSRRSFCENGTLRLTLVPGSRKQEIRHILPLMIESAKLLKASYPSLEVFISKCKHLPSELYDTAAKGYPFTLSEKPLRDLLESSDIALVTSGTATLETAMMGIPHVIVYRTSFLTYEILKRFAIISHIGLPNVLAEKEIVPELIQNDATAPKISAVLTKIIKNGEYRTKLLSDMKLLRAQLGSRTASSGVASIVVSTLNKKEIH